jgi:cyclomaltodextrinase
MVKLCQSLHIILFLSALSVGLNAQTRVKVLFRHYPTYEGVIRAFVTGSFNGWGPNSNGIIGADAPSRMNWSDSLGCYIKIFLLNADQSVQYKFHEHPLNQWITDPLNPAINTADNNNSVLHVRNGMIFEIFPRSGTVVTDPETKITAGICVAEGDSVLLDQSVLKINGEIASTFEGCYSDSLALVCFDLPDLDDGQRTFTFRVKTTDGLLFSDSISFTTRTAGVYFITPDQDDVFASPKTIRWQANWTDPDSMVLRHVGIGDTAITTQSRGEYSCPVNLDWGTHQFVIRVRGSDNIIHLSDTLTLRYPEPQQPEPEISMILQDGAIRLIAVPNDPQNQYVTCEWKNSAMNTHILPDLDGQTAPSLDIPAPDQPGDYAVRLRVRDPDGYSNTTETFFTVDSEGTVLLPSKVDVPRWVSEARIYSMFIKGFTTDGTIRSAAERLEYVRDLGFSVIWVLPVMDVEGTLDQGANIGYNIVDFYNVEPDYGTNADFKEFVQFAHDLGLRIILDVTPNHSSRSHPFAIDARSNGMFSRYWEFYQHDIISHDTNRLGQTVSSDGIVYYTGFSSALLNWNWADAEACKYMLDVYSHWLREYDIDGFRLDVYWGPHRRYGREIFDRPLREALRSVKADILILGETAGTGTGTEEQYADQTVGMDMGYDWNFFSMISGFPSIAGIHEQLCNWGYRPGHNSYFLRFLENHDEWRVANRYASIDKTMPVSAALFLSTGIPMLYQGQEIGMGFGMSGSKDDLSRSTIPWDNPPSHILVPHYQKLAQIRAQFPQFRRQYTDTNGDGLINDSDIPVQPRLSTSSSQVYAYGRPWPDANAVVAINFSSQPKDADVYLDPDSWMEFVTIPYIDVAWLQASNLYANTSELISKDLDTLHVSLEPYGVAVYILSVDEKTVSLPDIPLAVEFSSYPVVPGAFRLLPNYPNPFNPSTTMMCCIPKSMPVQIDLIDVLGRRVNTLFSGFQIAGIHTLKWNGSDYNGRQMPGGVYFVRMKSPEDLDVQKILLIR